MSMNSQGLIAGACLLVFALAMAGWRYVLVGFGPDFGMGVAVGSGVTAGILALLSRRVRHIS